MPPRSVTSTTFAHPLASFLNGPYSTDEEMKAQEVQYPVPGHAAGERLSQNLTPEPGLLQPPGRSMPGCWRYKEACWSLRLFLEAWARGLLGCPSGLLPPARAAQGPSVQRGGPAPALAPHERSHAALGAGFTLRDAFPQKCVKKSV